MCRTWPHKPLLTRSVGQDGFLQHQISKWYCSLLILWFRFHQWRIWRHPAFKQMRKLKSHDRKPSSSPSRLKMDLGIIGYAGVVGRRQDSYLLTLWSVQQRTRRCFCSSKCTMDWMSFTAVAPHASKRTRNGTSKGCSVLFPYSSDVDQYPLGPRPAIKHSKKTACLPQIFPNFCAMRESQVSDSLSRH